jgi:lysophospholipid acyltransferase (LPLAT)-like uncharacterized protein
VKITAYHRLQGWGLSTYASLVWRTARYEIEGIGRLDEVDATGRPLIVSAWHGMTMMLTGVLATHGDASRFVLVVPDDPRGAVLSTWARRMGTAPFPISMKDRSMAGARRLLALIRQMKEGKSLWITPDGPYGPTHEPKDGVIYMARKVGALIVPAAAFTATGYRIPRWDGYMVPFPFSRISVVLGPPFGIPPEAGTEEARGILRDQMNEVELAAEQMYRAGA